MGFRGSKAQMKKKKKAQRELGRPSAVRRRLYETRALGGGAGGGAKRWGCICGVQARLAEAQLLSRRVSVTGVRRTVCVCWRAEAHVQSMTPCIVIIYCGAKCGAQR